MLEAIHSDIRGLMNTNSMKTSRYLCLLFDYLQFITVYIIKQKLEAFTKFKEFLKLVKNKIGLKVKMISMQELRRICLEQICQLCRSHDILKGPTIPNSS